MLKSHKRYINILQGKTGRWIEGTTEADGLYTDEMTTCKIFLILGKKDGKQAISMTHYDGYTNLSTIQEEYHWFDEIKNVYICLKPEYALVGGSRDLFTSVIQPQLHNFKIPYQVLEMPRDDDAVTAGYDFNADRFSIGWINGTRLTEYPILLINHPSALTIYTYYKTNVMFSEIEGDLKHQQARYVGQSINNPNTLFDIYQYKFQHITLIAKSLATPIQHRQIIYDGKIFLDIEEHDKNFSSFANKVIDSVVKQVQGMVHPLNVLRSLAQQLVQLEITFPNFPSYHQPRNWGEEDQTSELAKFLCHLVFKLEDALPADYLEILKRYDENHQKNREKELLLAELKENNYTLYQTNGFFSPSKYATKAQPLGPYQDHLCCPDDLPTQYAIRLNHIH